jgi:hypothetical protein
MKPPRLRKKISDLLDLNKRTSLPMGAGNRRQMKNDAQAGKKSRFMLGSGGE